MRYIKFNMWSPGLVSHELPQYRFRCMMWRMWTISSNSQGYVLTMYRVQCWSDILNIIFKYHSDAYNEDSHFLITSGVWVFDSNFLFLIPFRFTQCKNLDTYQGISDNETLVSIWFRMVLLIQVTTRCIEGFHHLDIPTKSQYLIGVTTLIRTDKFSNAITNVDYWYHAFTYCIDQHWYRQFGISGSVTGENFGHNQSRS